MNVRSGLTLVELVVVLLILVLVAGTAITATEGLVGETRYETTRSELRSIEQAILGSYDSASTGEPDAISFAADIGRLPVARGVAPETQLMELWLKHDSVTAFGIQSPEGDPDVQIPAGWRGPYARVPLGLGDTRLYDGWGRAYDLFAADGSQAVDGVEIAMIRSLGANREPLGLDYDADATLVLSSTIPTALVGPRHEGSVPVRVTHAAVATERIVVRIYGPRDGSVVTIEQVTFDANGIDAVHTFERVPIGPRVVRAYRMPADPATPDTLIDIVMTPHTRITPITVVQGGIAEVELTLP